MATKFYVPFKNVMGNLHVPDSVFSIRVHFCLFFTLVMIKKKRSSLLMIEIPCLHHRTDDPIRFLSKPPAYICIFVIKISFRESTEAPRSTRVYRFHVNIAYVLCEDEHVRTEIIPLIYAALSLINGPISIAYYFLYIALIVVEYQVARAPPVLIYYLSVA